MQAGIYRRNTGGYIMVFGEALDAAGNSLTIYKHFPPDGEWYSCCFLRWREFEFICDITVNISI